MFKQILKIIYLEIFSDRENEVSEQDVKISDSGPEFYKNNEKIRVDLIKENEFLQIALANANMELNAKVGYHGQTTSI